MSTVNEPELRTTLVLNPPEDEAFGSFARALVENGGVAPLELQDRLRDRYPQAIVRPRELAGEQAHVWYVYRDGHWIRTGC